MVHSHYFLNNENRDVPDSVAIQSFDKSHIYEIEYPAQSRREDVPFSLKITVPHWYSLCGVLGERIVIHIVIIM